MNDLAHTDKTDTFKIDCVLMASGYSKRFGSNKLLEPWGNLSVIEVTLSSIPFEMLNEVVVVTRYREVEEICRNYPVKVVLHNLDHQSDTIRLGLKAVGKHGATMFLTCDQPLRTKSSLEAMIEQSRRNPTAFVQLAFGERKGNPIIFPCEYDEKLLKLKSGETGKHVMKHLDKLILVQALSEKELCDIDTREHYEELVKLCNL